MARQRIRKSPDKPTSIVIPIIAIIGVICLFVGVYTIYSSLQGETKQPPNTQPKTIITDQHKAITPKEAMKLKSEGNLPKQSSIRPISTQEGKISAIAVVAPHYPKHFENTTGLYELIDPAMGKYRRIS